MSSITLSSPEYTFTIGEGATARLGRHTDNDWTVPHDSVSRIHARISWRAGEARPVLVDLDSQNGTWVDGVVSTHEVPLEDGAWVELGGVTFRVELTTTGASARCAGRALLEQVEREERTGRLRIQLESGAVTLRLLCGEIVIGSETAKDTLLDLARVAAARVVDHRFEPDPSRDSRASTRRLRPSDALGSAERAWGLVS